MNCAEHLTQEVCYTQGGVRKTLIAHYTYGPANNAVGSALVQTVFTDAAGVPVDTSAGVVTVGACQTKPASLEHETFLATAGQTVFTLASVPVTDVGFARNGSTLRDEAATTAVDSLDVTYVPSGNSNIALLAGDRIDITYLTYPV